jgi:hypothetical protein
MASDKESESLYAVSPVVAVVLMMILVFAGTGIVAVTVFQTADEVDSNGIEKPVIDVRYESEAIINVKLIKSSNANVTIQTALGTEYLLDYVGQSVSIPNQEGDEIPAAYIEGGNGDKILFQQIPPQSFKPDAIIREDNDIQSVIDNLESGDKVVIERGEYRESVDITKNLTIIAEDGTEIGYDGEEDYVLKTEKPANIVNVDINLSRNDKHADFAIKKVHTNGRTVLADSKIRSPNLKIDDIEGVEKRRSTKGIIKSKNGEKRDD